MCRNEIVQISLLLSVDEVDELLPGAFDDFEVTLGFQ